MMIRSLHEVSKLAKEKGPKKLAIFAPEDGEFMMAVKEGWERKYIEPVPSGRSEKMKKIAVEGGFDIAGLAGGRRIKKISVTRKENI